MGRSRKTASKGAWGPGAQIERARAAALRVLHSEQAARAEAERSARRAAFIAEASALLTSSLDYEHTLASLADLAVSELADWCVVHIEEAGTLKPLAVSHTEPARLELARELEGRFPADTESAPYRVLRSGQPELFTTIPDSLLEQTARNPEHLALLKQLGLRSAMLVPLMARGHTLGVISFVSTRPDHSYNEDDLALVEQLARHAALAVDNARLYREARSAARARDEIIAVVSHDLKNPLNIISMATELLADPDLPEETRRDCVGRLDRAARRMGQLVRDLLDVTRLDSGALPLDRRSVEPAELLLEAVQLIEPLAEDKHISLETRVADNLPLIQVDRERLLQVFSNLLGNAIKFTPPHGAVEVRAERTEESVRFSVRDTGPGIPRRHQPHVFDRFYQVHPSGRQGAGLGLAIARGLVEAHGGRIGLASEPGAGTTFFFSIPTGGS